MANELSISSTLAVQLFQNGGEIGEVLKPLQHEIFLLSTQIAGTGYIENQEIFSDLKPGTLLHLQREDNQYDPLAILVLFSEHEKLGYVPRKENRILARLMDGGKLLQAKVTGVETEAFIPVVQIDIFLLDF